MSDPDYKDILYRLIASMSLCDHMGDVMSDCMYALKDTGIKLPDEVDEISKLMPYMFREQGITKTSVGSDIDDEGYDEDYCWVGYGE